MMAPTHMAASAAGALGLLALAAHEGVHVTLWHIAAGVAVATVSALIPDADHPSSRISRAAGILTVGMSHLVRFVSARVYDATRTEADRPRGGKHRGLTHTPVGAIVFGLAVAGALLLVGQWWPPAATCAWLGAPVGFGCLMHIGADFLTKEGVPLLWPLKVGGKRWRRFHIPLVAISTDHFAEHFLYLPAFVFAAGWCAYLTLA